VDGDGDTGLKGQKEKGGGNVILFVKKPRGVNWRFDLSKKDIENRPNSPEKRDRCSRSRAL